MSGKHFHVYPGCRHGHIAVNISAGAYCVYAAMYGTGMEVEIVGEGEITGGVYDPPDYSEGVAVKFVRFTAGLPVEFIFDDPEAFLLNVLRGYGSESIHRVSGRLK
jgi:hypothetical protein